MDYGEAMVDKAMYNVAKLRIYGACSIHLVRSCQICCLVINKKQHENFRIVAQTLILMLFCIDTRAKSLIPAFRTLYEGPVFDVLSNRFISFENLVKVKKNGRKAFHRVIVDSQTYHSVHGSFCSALEFGSLKSVLQLDFHIS
jgi:hypothetical protein